MACRPGPVGTLKYSVNYIGVWSLSQSVWPKEREPCQHHGQFSILLGVLEGGQLDDLGPSNFAFAANDAIGSSKAPTNPCGWSTPCFCTVVLRVKLITVYSNQFFPIVANLTESKKNHVEF